MIIKCASPVCGKGKGVFHQFGFNKVKRNEKKQQHMVDLAFTLFTHSSVCETPRMSVSIKHKGLTFGNFGKHSTRKGLADHLCKSPLLKGYMDWFVLTKSLKYSMLCSLCRNLNKGPCTGRYGDANLKSMRQSVRACKLQYLRCCSEGKWWEERR